MGPERGVGREKCEETREEQKKGKDEGEEK